MTKLVPHNGGLLNIYSNLTPHLTAHPEQDASIVDQHIQPAIFLLHCIPCGQYALLAVDIQLQQYRVQALRLQLPSGCLPLLDITSWRGSCNLTSHHHNKAQSVTQHTSEKVC